jgi:hypothetical protein
LAKTTSAGNDMSGSESSSEIETPQQLERVAAIHAQIMAHVREAAVGPLRLWLGHLGRDHAPVATVHDRVRDEERIATHRLDFHVCRVSSVPLFNDRSYDRRGCFLSKASA